MLKKRPPAILKFLSAILTVEDQTVDLFLKMIKDDSKQLSYTIMSTTMTFVKSLTDNTY